MIFDINSLKETLLDYIRTYVYPQQTSHSGSISLYSKGTIDQPFYPFCSTLTTGQIYVSSIAGTPGEATIEILSRGSKLFSTHSTLHTGWNAFNISKGDIVSRSMHTLRVYGDVDPSNDYYIGVGSGDTYFYGTLDSGDVMAFSIGVRDFVRKVFPMTEELSTGSLPMVVFDINARGLVRDRYLTGDMLIEEFQVGVEVYSRYTDEVDRLCYGIERGLVKDRKALPGIQYLTPLYLSGLSFISPEIFRRDITFNIMAFITRE